MKTIARNRKKYIEEIFDRPTLCRWYNETNGFNGKNVSPHFAKKHFADMPFAKIKSHENGRFIIEIHHDSWFEITNMRLFQ